MKVYFIGAGPGSADLITVRGAKILGRVAVVLYAGSLVSREMLVHCRTDAQIVNTAKLSLDEQEARYTRARDLDLDVARLHSGDPSIYGATAEQMRHEGGRDSPKLHLDSIKRQLDRDAPEYRQ